jgi:hypothetical protein
MSILPQFQRRFLKDSMYPRATFRSVETLQGIRTLTLNNNGVIVRLSGAHAERWIVEHRRQLGQAFSE